MHFIKTNKQTKKLKKKKKKKKKKKIEILKINNLLSSKKIGEYLFEIEESQRFKDVLILIGELKHGKSTFINYIA